MNANFSTIQSVVNSLDNSNIAVGAQIDPAKLDATKAYPLLLQAAATYSFRTGNTGDSVSRWGVSSDGIMYLGAGGASAVDLALVRSGAGIFAIRNGTNSADAALTCSTVGASSNITGTGLFGTSLGLTNGNRITFTPASMAAARAITVVDPLAAASQRFTTGAFTANGVVTTDGTNLTSSAAASNATQVFKGDLTWGTTNVFGGNGVDSAIVATGTSAVRHYEATTFSVAGSTTGTFTNLQINATSTVTITGTLTCSPSVAGGQAGGATTAALIASDGVGSVPGRGGQVSGAGGAGGGCAGAGGTGSGNGGSPTTVVPGPTGYTVGSVETLPFGLSGSGGGGGAGVNASATGGNGGLGGSRLTVCAVGAISIPGTLNIKGGAGSAGGASNGGGGGGGSGGVGLLASQTSVTIAGTVDLTGGAGGNGNGTGGGGGGGSRGILVLWSPSNSTGSITNSSAGGAAGTGGTNVASAGNASGVNVVSITGNPNMPLIVKLERDGDILFNLPSKNLKNSDVAALLANGNVIDFFTYMSGSMDTTCEAIGDAVELAPAA